MTRRSTQGVLGALTLLAACAASPTVQTRFDRPYPERNAAGAPILAVFVGRVPCATRTCEMRKVELVLYGREGSVGTRTYWLGQVRVGAGNEHDVAEGAWQSAHGLRDHPLALRYELDARADPSLRRLWRVSEDVMLVLDEELRPRPGNGAWGFMLSRDCAPYGPRDYAYDERAGRFAPAAPPSPCGAAGAPSPEARSAARRRGDPPLGGDVRR
jgi:hypothetical protein